MICTQAATILYQQASERNRAGWPDPSNLFSHQGNNRIQMKAIPCSHVRLQKALSFLTQPSESGLLDSCLLRYRRGVSQHKEMDIRQFLQFSGQANRGFLRSGSWLSKAAQVGWVSANISDSGAHPTFLELISGSRAGVLQNKFEKCYSRFFVSLFF